MKEFNEVVFRVEVILYAVTSAWMVVLARLMFCVISRAEPVAPPYYILMLDYAGILLALAIVPIVVMA